MRNQVALVALAMFSVGAAAQSITVGDYRIDRETGPYQVESLSENPEFDHTDVHTTDGRTFDAENASFGLKLTPSSADGFFSRSIPAAGRDQPNRLMIYRLTTHLKNSAGQTVAYQMRGDGPILFARASINPAREKFLSRPDMLEAIRNAPKGVLVDIPWGSTQVMFETALKTKDYGDLIEVVKAMQARSNYADSDFAKYYAKALNGLVYKHAEAHDLVELLDHPPGSGKVDALAKGGAIDTKKIAGEVAKEAVRDAGAGK